MPSFQFREFDGLYELSDELSSLHLSVRARNCLLNANAQSIADIEHAKDKELLGIYNCGEKTVKEIRNALAARRSIAVSCWQFLYPDERFI